MVQEQLPKKASAIYYVLAVVLVAGVIGFGVTAVAELSALNFLAAFACAVALVAVAFAITRGGKNSPVVRNR